MKELKNLVSIVYFRIGVNSIGLPIDVKHTIHRRLNKTFMSKKEIIDVVIETINF